MPGAGHWTLPSCRSGLGVKVENGETRRTKEGHGAPTRPCCSRRRATTLSARARHEAPQPRGMHPTSGQALEATAQHGLGLNRRAAVVVRLRTVAKVSGAVAAIALRSTLSAMFARAIGGDHRDHPVNGTKKASDNNPRERVRSDAELAAIGRRRPIEYGRIVRLLMLTAQRRQERLPVMVRGGSRGCADISSGPANQERLAACRAAVQHGPGGAGCRPRREGRALVFGNGQVAIGLVRHPRRHWTTLPNLPSHGVLHYLRRMVPPG